MHTGLIKTLMPALFFCFFLLTVTENGLAENTIAPGTVPSDTSVLNNTACIQCHNKHDKQLIKDWQNSAHAAARPAVNCVSCHGQLHRNMASSSRHDETCVNCHGVKNPVVHSYSSSKHGTLMRLEKNSYDWKQPFEQAKYRAPGCGYCHMHSRNHNVSTTVRHNLLSGQTNDPEIENVHDNTRGVCQDCHSPRYITRLFSNGEAMLEIARKKVREAGSLIQQAQEKFNEDDLIPAKQQFEKMQHHLKNVHLGIGHQSPDYQWWHGQPALDGDLLRIKDIIGELHRTKR